MPFIHRLIETPTNIESNAFYFIRNKEGIDFLAGSGTGLNKAFPLKPRVTVDGPTELIYGAIGRYEITNYGMESSYTVSSTDGSVELDGDYLSLSCNDLSKSKVEFTLNERVFTVHLKSILINAPTILSPVNNSTNVSTSGLTLTSNAFSMNDGSTDNHVATDWEIATDENFTNVVASSYSDGVNKTTYTP